ncbi:MAG: DNA polymerase III subunit delta' [Xanthobacteraceae bacterium]
MTDADDEGPVEAAHPRATQELFGHAEAERALLDAYRGSRIPHAWLIGGPRGIGKATLAYRMARFVLAHPDPHDAAVKAAASLAVDPEHRVARRVASQGQGDLLVLERTIGERGKLRQDIAVDDVRRSVSFFGSTAGEGGWRVAIVDSVDELNAAGMNALLKVVEEPPPRALLLLVSHARGTVPATIRSRCRVLNLRPLSDADVARAAAAALGRDAGDAEVMQAARLAEGSVGRAIGMLDGPTLDLRQRLMELLDRLPDADPKALHALGDAIAGTDPETLEAFIDTINGWLSARIASGLREGRQPARLAEAWEKVNRAASETKTFNLERKPLVFSVFGVLAEAARG